jgi:hypothetical protein
VLATPADNDARETFEITVAEAHVEEDAALVMRTTPNMDESRTRGDMDPTGSGSGISGPSAAKRQLRRRRGSRRQRLSRSSIHAYPFSLCFYLICFLFLPAPYRRLAPSKGSGGEECGPSTLIISFVFLFDLFLKFLYQFG